jgi:hypothetical protein
MIDTLHAARFVKSREGDSYYTIGGLHFTHAERDGILVREQCGRYRIEIFHSRYGGLAHQLVLDTQYGPMRVRAVTRAEERAYPRTAGLRANAIIDAMEQRHVEPPPQLSLLTDT